jgi:hypothetical protein
MLRRNDALNLDHCHHCGVDAPNMTLDSSFVTNNHRQDAPREWSIYHCESCGGAVLTGAIAGSGVISEIYPAALKDSQVPCQHESLATVTMKHRHQRQHAASIDASVAQQPVH